jgi:CBS domain containing-hemolysin-like protein
LDTDIPLPGLGALPALLGLQAGSVDLLLAPLSDSYSTGLPFWLGLLCALASGIIAGAVLAGIARRSVVRSQAWRGFAAWLSSLGLGMLLLSFGLARALQTQAATGPGDYSLDAAAYGMSLALAVCGLMALGSALATRATSPRRGVPRLASNLTRAFTPFWRFRSGGSEEQEQPDFEITMASGVEVEAEERELIENILELGETTVREVMKPRPDVLALDVEWPAERILAEVAGSRFSRFPVYEETIDNVIGVLHLRGLFEFVARGDGLENFDLRSLMAQCWFIPESKKVDDALRELQRQKGHLAVVLDEFGGTAGIVTIEDLLEEIVGEIQDEYDEESKLAHQREDGSWVVTAQLPINDLNELLDVSLTAENVDTVGGLVVGRLGRIPKAQETLEIDDLRFTVLSVEKNRIGRLKVERRNGSLARQL